MFPKQITCFFLVLISLVSCRKEEENYDFVVEKDVARFQVIICQSIFLLNSVEDSLIHQMPFLFEGDLQYVSGDSANPTAPNTALVYKVDYGMGLTDYDGRLRSGSLIISKFPSGDEHLYQIYFDSLETSSYMANGRVFIDAIEGKDADTYEWEINTTDFSIDGPPGQTSIRTNMVYRKDPATGQLYFKVYREDGVASDEREFKFQSSEDLVWDPVCQKFTAGRVNIKPRTYTWRDVIYGRGNCGETAVGEIGSISQGFPLL